MILNNLYQLQKALRVQWLSSKKIKDLQFKKLKFITEYAYKNIYFYNRFFKKNNFNPDKLNKFEDILKIPVLKKDLIRKYGAESLINTKLKNIPAVIRQTSGSSGVSMTIKYDKNSWDFAEAIYARDLISVGYKPWMRMAHFWPEPFNKKNFYEKVGLLKRTWISTMRDNDYQFNLLTSINPQVIFGFPSTLLILSRLAQSKNIKLSPKLIFTSGEMLTKDNRQMIENVYSSEIFDQYGCQEVNRMAFECNEHSGYHIDEDAVLLEFVKNQEHISERERGNIVVTGLFNKAMPFIRYEIGDIGSPIFERCACGRGFSRMSIIEGRQDSFISLSDGSIIGPRTIKSIIDDSFLYNNKISNYRIHQKTKKLIEIEIVPGKDYHEGNLVDINNLLCLIFNQQVKLKFKIIDDIKKSRLGKLRYIQSDVKLKF